MFCIKCLLIINFVLQCSVQEFYAVCRSLSTVLCEVEGVKKWLSENSCPLLQTIFSEIPDLLSDVTQYKEALSEAGVKLVLFYLISGSGNEKLRDKYHYINIW